MIMKKEKFGRIVNIISISVKSPIDNLGVSNTVRWAMASWAKTLSNEVAELMNSSSVLLMASSFEGLPRILIEGGLCELPSISSDIQGISTPFGSDGGTMLYEYENLDKLVLKLIDFFKDEEKQIQLGKDSLELAQKLAGKGKFLHNWKNIETSLYG